MVETQTQDKEELYKELLEGKKPGAIFILSGGIVKRERGYSTTAYSDTQGDYGVLGGKARVVAAAELSKFYPEAKLVSTATYYPTPGDPSQSQIMESELLRLGVDKSQIKTEEYSRSTYDELSRIIALSLENDWHNIAVVTNEYHLPRVKEMLAGLNELATNKNDESLLSLIPRFEKASNISFVSAEDVMVLRSPHYKSVIEEAKKHPDYKKRVEAENRGLQALKSGTYGKK